MTLRKFSGTDDLPDGFAALLDDAGDENLFLRRDWFDLLERTALPEDQEAFYLGLEIDGATAALLPLRRDIAPPRWPRLRLLSAHANFYSMDFAPIVAPGMQDTAVLARLFFRDATIIPRLGCNPAGSAERGRRRNRGPSFRDACRRAERSGIFRIRQLV